MKRVIYLFLFLIFSISLYSQQEEQFTQFMYYKMGFNPGYAGTRQSACFTVLSRSQWLGIEGAPQTQLLTFNMPLFNQRVGIGASIVRELIGVTEKVTGEAVYAYRMRIGRGMLGIGLQGSVRLMRIRFSDTDSTQEIDQAIPGDIQSKYIPNFGAGLYYNTNQFYVGFSAPRLLRNNIDFSDLDQTISKEVQHIYLMGGLLIKLSDKLEMQPQTIFKMVKGAPFDADVNLNFIFNNNFTLGASYRLGGSKRSGIGESLSFVLGVQINDSLLFGAAYDATLSELQKHNSGTIEGVLRYCLGGRSQGDDIMSPRFF